MNLYLVRHAIAEPARGGVADSARALTPEGKEKMAQAASGLERMGVVAARLLSSPIRRAQETAAILAPCVGDPEITLVDSLACGAEPADFLDALRPHASETSVAIVGHEPDLGHFASYLIADTASGHSFPFLKGAVACFDFEIFPRGHQAALSWFLQAKHLRSLVT